MAVRNLTDVLLDEDVATILAIVNQFTTVEATALNKILTQAQVIDTLLSTEASDVLSANQGLILKAMVDANIADIALISEAIGNLASAQGTISDTGVPMAITLVEQKILFDEVVASTNTDIFVFDAVANTITFKKPGNYNFVSSVTLEAGSGGGSVARTVTFTLRNATGGAIISEQALATEIQSGSKQTAPINTLVVVADGDEPLTIEIFIEADITGLTLDSFSSLLVSMATATPIADHADLTGRSTVDSHPQSAITGLVAALAAKAPLASPALTGTPTAPTATPGDNTTKLATTAFVIANGGGSGTTIAAWVKFKGTGTVAINASDNITSITDLGVGKYRINFTTAFIDTDYIMLSTGSKNSGQTNPRAILFDPDTARTTTSCTILTEIETGENRDLDEVNCAFLR